MKQHYALIGIALVADEYPLYFDAANEKGLGMAGLNYPDNFKAFDVQEGKDNVTPFEFIPWVLGQCASVDELAALGERKVGIDKLQRVGCVGSTTVETCWCHEVDAFGVDVVDCVEH